MGEGVQYDIDPPNEVVLPFGGSYIYTYFADALQQMQRICCTGEFGLYKCPYYYYYYYYFGENRSRNATMRVPTDGHTDTEANRFYILSRVMDR